MNWKIGLAFGLIALLAGCERMGISLPTSIISTDKIEKRTIALLVPRGSEDENFDALADDFENGAKLALSELKAEDVQLEVIATQGTVEGAESAYLIAQEAGVSVIVGPAFSDTSQAVARLADQSNTSIFSFSNDSRIAGGNLYLLGQTFENTSENLVRYAASQGRSRALIVHADTFSGLRGRVALEAAALQNQIELLDIVAYEFSQIGAVEAVTKIVESVELNDPNIIFFTANSAGALPLMTQLLREKGVEREKVKFAGITRWDIPESALSVSGMQGGWFTTPDPNLSASFSHRYQFQYESPPHPLAGLAYDATVVAVAMIGKNGGKVDPADVISDPMGFVGATGIFRFNPDGTSERGLAVAEVTNHRVNIIQRAPKTFVLSEEIALPVPDIESIIADDRGTNVGNSVDSADAPIEPAS